MSLLPGTICNVLSDLTLSATASMQNQSTSDTTSHDMASSSHLAGLDLDDEGSDGLEELPAGCGVALHASSSSKFIYLILNDR